MCNRLTLRPCGMDLVIEDREMTRLQRKAGNQEIQFNYDVCRVKVYSLYCLGIKLWACERILDLF